MCAKSGLIYEKAKKGEKTNAKAMGSKQEGKNQDKEGEKHKIRGQTKTRTHPTRMRKEGLFEKVTFALRLGLKKECSQLRAQ